MELLNLPYMIPLFLGMTFDARNSRAGVDIYDLEYVNDPKVSPVERTESIYKITSSMSEVQELLKIDGDLSLKIKTGMINVDGMGSYLKSTRDYKNTVEILTRLKYISGTQSFKSNAKPKQSWPKLFSTGVLGTHYVTGVTYGAELLASARFVVKNSSDVSKVRAEVNSAFKTDGEAVDLVAGGELENLRERVSDEANLEISYYGTVPLLSIPNTVEGLTTLIQNFKEQIDKTQLKNGIPMSVELTPLTNIVDAEEKDRFEFLKNRNWQNEMADFEEQLDEMREARSELTAWAKTLPYEIDREIEREVGLLLKNITSTLEVYYEHVWRLDVTKSPEQLKPAFDVYDFDKEGTYLRFGKLVRKLQARLEPKINREDVTSDTYIQYGSNNCTANKAVTLYDGFVITSAEEGIGGTAVYECIPRSANKGYNLDDNIQKSHLAGIRYTKLDKEFNPFKGVYAKQIEEKGMTCAKCYSPDSTSVAMFPSTDKCPLTWETMYTGYLMSARKSDGHTTKFICVDEKPSKPYNMDKQPSSRDTLALTVVHGKGSLPESTYLEGALVRCVLCSMKINQIVG